MSSLGPFPYEAIAGKRYKSPHKNDLSFAKGDRIRVLSLAPKDEDDEEDEDDDEPDQWLVGETLDGTKTGTFPASHVQAVSVEPAQDTPAVAAPAQADSSKSSEEKVASKRETNEEPVADELSQDKDIQQEIPKKEPIPPSDIKAEDATPAAAPISPTVESASPPAAIQAVSQRPNSPPVAPKPGGLAARIAAFNRPQEAAAPPPLPRGKPGGWKRPEPAPGAPKPVLPASTPAPQTKVASTAPPPAPASPPVNAEDAESGSQSRSNAAFSAADAQSSIKMSLKERMAALQRGDLADAASSKPAAPAPKPAPGRIAEEKRKAAMAGVGGGAAAVSKAEEGQADDGESIVTGGEENNPTQGAETADVNGEGTEEAKEAVPVLEGEEGEDEKTEEEKESERRAAIAKRMASLGGRRMGGGPAIFGAPAPIPAKKPTGGEVPTTAIVASEEITSDDPSSPTAKEASREIEQEPEQPGKTLAVPRRAAPPRKKKSSASSAQTAESASNVAPQDRQDSKASVESGLESQAPEGKEAGVGGQGHAGVSSGVLAGAGVAAGGLVLEGSHSLTEDPVSVDAASSYGDQTSEFEPGTPISEGQMDENARQLEEFVRTPREEEGDEMDGAEEEASATPSTANARPPIPVSSPPPPSHDPPSIIGRPPSARPPSARPPVPKASLLDGGETERSMSPAPTRAPPVPAAGRRESLLQSSSGGGDEAEKEEEEGAIEQPTILAKPKARMAVPVDLSDDEDGEGETETDPRGLSAVSPAAPAVERAAAEPSEEMTEEEEDRQRRARISAKMARMGGQPIMGAPIAFKNPSVPAVLPVDDTTATEAEVAPEEDERGQEAFSDPPTPSLRNTVSPPPIPQSMSPPPPIPQAAIPPVPTKSPPPPMMQGNATSIERRMSQMSTSEDASSLAQRASMLGRPPFPTGKQSREASSSTGIDEEMDDNQQTQAFAPPALPSSPPPRAPPRAPSVQPSQAEEESAAVPAVIPTSPPRRGSTLQQQQQPRRSGSRSSHERGASREAIPRSSRDLDLMPSSRWWRHGLPVKLPPTLLRPDAYPLVTTQDQGQQHLIRIELIFEDYSATVVEVRYEDDDANEEATQLSQHHSFSPRRPSSAELQSWSQRYGAPVAKQATSALQSKTIVGNGTSKDFIFALLAMSGSDDILPPVGSSFGSIILAQAATTPVDVGSDEIRTGDIVALHGVDFKGKKGLGSYHATFGSTQEPTYACVIESEGKKRKLRCILVPGVEGKRNRAPEEVSLRLDDVKSGLLRIFRLAPKTGWLSM